jgi:hypothetical protein
MTPDPQPMLMDSTPAPRRCLENRLVIEVEGFKGGEDLGVWLTDTDIDLSGLDLVGNLFKPKDSTSISLSSSAIKNHDLSAYLDDGGQPGRTLSVQSVNRGAV